MVNIDPILGIIKPEDLAHLQTIIQNREHDIAWLEAEIVQLKDESAGLHDQILILEHKLREVTQ